MTEHEWLASDDPRAMLRFLTDRPQQSAGGNATNPRHPSDRKLRLFAQACEVSFYTTRQPRKWLSDLEASHPGSSPLRDAEYWAHEMRHPERPRRANLLREIIGNPFRPVLQKESEGCLVRTSGRGGKPHHCHTHNKDVVYVGTDKRTRYAVCPESLEYFRANYCTPTVLEMAKHAYDSRDFSNLPILADALEEAGCDHEHLLRHLRGEELVPSPHMPKLGLWQPQRSPHVRGCWAIDLILGEDRHG